MATRFWATASSSKHMAAQCSDIFSQLESWYRNQTGLYLDQQVRSAAQDCLDRSFGYHSLQLGLCGKEPLADVSPINHRVYCAEHNSSDVQLLAQADELPLESDSIDAIVAQHCLEFTPHPHQALREMQRVLTPQGQLLIVGFNPYSLLGINAYLRGLSRASLWRQHRPISENRLTDWLRVLGCEVQAVTRVCAVPPAGAHRIRDTLLCLDQWCARFNLPVGGVYVIHASKQVAGLNRPRRVVRLRRERLVGLVTKPAAPAPTPAEPAHKVHVNSAKEA
ncbi:MAG: methyltransferase domain-containing protein [Gammaproteobacteria bacterium]|nr:methyltransferase domain-containing protein [Gammaproteobacteria bacterium]